MPDISMCIGNECPSKDECYRFRAIANGDRQSYANFSCKGAETKCKHFWPIEGQRVEKRKASVEDTERSCEACLHGIGEPAPKHCRDCGAQYKYDKWKPKTSVKVTPSGDE